MARRDAETIRKLFTRWNRQERTPRHDPRPLKDQRAYTLHGDPEAGLPAYRLRHCRPSRRNVRKVWAQQQGPKWVIYALAPGMYDGEAMVIAVVYFKADVAPILKALRAIQ